MLLFGESNSMDLLRGILLARTFVVEIPLESSLFFADTSVTGKINDIRIVDRTIIIVLEDIYADKSDFDITMDIADIKVFLQNIRTNDFLQANRIFVSVNIIGKGSSGSESPKLTYSLDLEDIGVSDDCIFLKTETAKCF